MNAIIQLGYVHVCIQNTSSRNFYTNLPFAVAIVMTNANNSKEIQRTHTDSDHGIVLNIALSGQTFLGHVFHQNRQ